MVLLASSVYGVNPTYQMEIKNDQQISANEFIFDIYIKNIPNVTWPTFFELASIQVGLQINAGILNGGAITPTIVSGYSDLLPSQQQTDLNLSMAGTIWGLKMTTVSPLPGAGSGTHIINSEMRVCRIKLTNSTSFTTGLQMNFVWSHAPTTPWRTTVTAYIPALTPLASNDILTNFSNPYLNSWNGFVSNDWSNDANWSPAGKPANNADAYIPAAATAPHITALPSTPTKCQNITIASGGSLFIDGGKALTVNGNITNDGTFTIKSDATGTGSFINGGTLGGSGTYTVEKYLTDHRWWYLGSPLSNGTSSAFGTISPDANTGNRLFSWNENGHAYANVGSTGVPMPALQGYTFESFFGSPQTAQFTGNLNTGTIGGTSNLSYTAGTSQGYNLVSNPYPSAINWGCVNTPTAGLTQTNLVTTIWYRKNGSFATYNSSGNGIGQNGGERFIPAMQAFWVKTNGSTGGLELTNAARVHDGTSFYKTSETNVFRVELADSTFTDEAVIRFYEDAQNIFENFDSEKMFTTDNDVAQIYTSTSDNMDVAINGLPELLPAEERTIAIGFKTPKSANFSFNATNLSEFDQNISVYIEDVQQNVIQNLRQSPIYNFSSGNVDNNSRFRLHFVNTITGISAITQDQSDVYSYGNSVYVNVLNSGTGTVELYDALGNLVYKQSVEKGLNKLSIDLTQGIYISNIKIGNTESTKKIVILK